ncbi:MAG: EcsC family protein [Propionibacteriaceae bacterium]|nr:EcsC family protein [Propionibacteriaceae bacterium]
MAPESRDVSKNPVARAPEVGGNLLRTLLETAITGTSTLPGAKSAAAKHLAKKSGIEDALESLVLTHVGLAGAQGFLTSLGGLPTLAVTLPANIAGLAVVQIRLIASIAHLRGYDIDSRQVRTAMTLCLMGREGTQKLVDSGVLPTTPLAIATAPVFDETLDQVVGEKVLGELLSRIGGRRASLLFARRVPLLGGGVGATMDGLSTIEIGGYARDVFVSRRRLGRGD